MKTEQFWLYPELEFTKFSKNSDVECERKRGVKLKAKIRSANVQTFLYQGVIRGLYLPELISVWLLFVAKGRENFYSRIPE